MKIVITQEQWDGLPEGNRMFYEIWKQRKGYTEKTLRLDQCIELLAALSRSLHTDDSDGRFFNFLLQNQESLIAWDGDGENNWLIDTLWYEQNEVIKKRLATGIFFDKIAS